jgi:hypothetical protein
MWHHYTTVVYSPKPLSLDEGTARIKNEIHEIREQQMKNILNDLKYLFERYDVTDGGYICYSDG